MKRMFDDEATPEETHFESEQENGDDDQDYSDGSNSDE